ncbi:hydrolase [Galdieria sulphuraria]|uniref:Hydrolase n=1 Tax=Galdieria sulphuraria TaxID=130081 RepID=M2Y195_GALSU|nr:hydrolase [Galdieria sulphuraria]EME29698.1 hydrolase [Galdieria sulphuraria]|eukprot:XP_005706218.1 hydrolase [Galdieria sulphuraria]
MERRYSEALVKLYQVIRWVGQQRSLTCLVHLGDLVDGSATEQQTRKEYSQVCAAFDDCKVPVLHVVGNHCLDVSRDVLKELFPSTRFYYRWEPHDDWCFLFLDCLEISCKGAINEHYQQEAQHYLETQQQQPRATRWNGAISSTQLEWLENELQHCQRKVIVMGHIPLVEEASDAAHLVWNAEQVLDILHRYHHLVIAYFAGHYHRGGYAVDAYGLHHVTFPAICDAPAHQNAWAKIRCEPHRIVIQGYGTVPSQTWTWSPCKISTQ